MCNELPPVHGKHKNSHLLSQLFVFRLCADVAGHSWGGRIGNLSLTPTNVCGMFREIGVFGYKTRWVGLVQIGEKFYPWKTCISNQQCLLLKLAFVYFGPAVCMRFSMCIFSFSWACQSTNKQHPNCLFFLPFIPTRKKTVIGIFEQMRFGSICILHFAVRNQWKCIDFSNVFKHCLQHKLMCSNSLSTYIFENRRWLWKHLHRVAWRLIYAYEYEHTHTHPYCLHSLIFGRTLETITGEFSMWRFPCVTQTNWFGI